MKYAAPLAIALIVLFPSCATQTAIGPDGASAPAQESDGRSEAPSATPGATPMGAYRSAQQAAGAINTVRTLGSLF